jgi:hypothetical protein
MLLSIARAVAPERQHVLRLRDSYYSIRNCAAESAAAVLRPERIERDVDL